MGTFAVATAKLIIIFELWEFVCNFTIRNRIYPVVSNFELWM